jgi:hypothetical protein
LKQLEKKQQELDNFFENISWEWWDAIKSG